MLRDDELAVNVLGPLEVWRAGRELIVPAGKFSVMLAVLASSAGQAVSLATLGRYVWADRSPKRLASSVQGLVLRLRQELGNTAIVTVQGGYLLDLPPERVDMLLFRRMVGQAAQAGPAEAARLLDTALGLWRGEPFQGLGSDALEREFTDQLVEERLAAVRQHIDLDLAAGRYEQVVPQLRRLARQYPLRETLWHQLILALAGDGRRGEAVAAYHEARMALREHLGMDPSAELQEAYQALLAGDRVVAVSEATPVRAAGAVEPVEPVTPNESAAEAAPGRPIRRDVPRQMPAPPRSFVGRKRELSRLTGALAHGDHAAGTAVVVGAGGLGKTWLALRWAYDNLDRFPDGQLYVDLRGFDPSAEPTSAMTALRGFLEALGVDRGAIPLDTDAQVGLYRGLTAGKRMLVVLDNALDTAHVAPLLPDTRSCTVLVTGRGAFTGMVTAHGAERVGLDVLDEADAWELLIRHLDPGVTAAEPDAIAELLQYCAGLPLALTIVAARAASRSGFPLSALAAELAVASRRLDALSTGELTTNLRAVFAASSRTLDAAAMRAFGLFGLAPTADFDVTAAAAVAGLAPVRAQVLLRELEAANLLVEHLPGRYRMHDLIRLYAAENAPDEPEALDRLVDFYLHTAHSGERQLATRKPIEIEPPAEGSRPLEFTDPATALRWFDVEHANLLSIHRLAIDRGWDSCVWQLAWSLGSYHWRRGDHHDNLATWQAAVAATQHMSRPDLEAQVYRRLGLAAGRAGEVESARRHLHDSLLLTEQVGDAVEEAYTLHSLAWLCAQRGDDAQALSHALHALDLIDSVADPTRRASAHNDVGWYYARLGKYPQAEHHCLLALELFRQLGDLEGQADVLDSLGLVALGVGRHAEALDHYRRALALFREVGHAYEEANTLAGVGEAQYALGLGEEARQAWQLALSLYQAQHRTEDSVRIQRRLAESRSAGGSGHGEGSPAGT